jgi:hypothetical protein
MPLRVEGADVGLTAAQRRRARRQQAADRVRVGPVEEDGSFRVRGGKVYDPETGRIRSPIGETRDSSERTVRPSDSADTARRSREVKLQMARDERRRRSRRGRRLPSDDTTRSLSPIERQERRDEPPRRRRQIDRLIDDTIHGRREPRQVKAAFDRMRLSDAEKQYVREFSAGQSRQATRRVEKGFEGMAGVLGLGELAKLLPGGTPAGEASPGWGAVEAASVLPVVRGGRLAGRGARTAARAVLPERATRPARSLRVGDRVEQLPAARSRVTRNLIERPADAASRAMMGEGRVAAAARRVLPTASAQARVAKEAGRKQTFEAARAGAKMARHTKALPKEGSRADTAHFWWAQLPKTHRNARGLAAVRGKQAAELADLTSGRALDQITRRQGAVRAKLGEATDDNRFELLGELEELKTLASDLPNRIDDLARSIAQLDKVIAKPPKLDDKVIDAVRALSGDRRTILEGAGVLKPERAQAREGLVSGWVGLERTGDEAFIGHRIGKPRGAQPSLMPVSVGTGRVRLPEGVARENKLVLAKSGRVRASTQVAAQDWQAAQVYRQATQARTDLAEMGNRFAGRVPDGHVLVNPKGRALPAQWKTDRLPHIPEGDEEALKEAAEEIVRSFLAEGDDVAAMLDAAKKAGVSWDELRVAPKAVVQRYYGQFLPARGATKGGRVYDAAVDFTAASIVFARVGYIPKNIAQGLIMSVPHQGPFLLVNAPRAGQALADPQLRPLLRAEVGFSGATQGLASEFSGLAGAAKKARGAPAKVAGAVGAVGDDPMRISAFLHEAAAAGVISKLNPVFTQTDKAKLHALLTDPQYRPLLNDIRSRSVEAMADFSRLTPSQRKWARRFLVIPGWLYAGSRYPIHFAATHPGRSAAIAYAAAGEPYADQAGLPQNPPVTDAFADDLPSFVEGIETPWGVERTTSLSPVSTPWEIGLAATGRSERTLGDYANPLGNAAYNVLRRRVEYPGGSYQTSASESARRNLERLAPNVDLVRDLVSPSGEGRYPEDASRLGRLKRELGVLPIEIERERSAGDSVGIVRQGVRQELRDVVSGLRTQAPELLRGTTLPKRLRQAYGRKESVDVLRKQVAEEVGQGEPYHRLALEREVALLREWDLVGKQKAREIAGVAETGSLDDVRHWRDVLREQGFSDAYLELIGAAKDRAGVSR